MDTIQVFRYIEELDAFLVTEEFTAVSGYLGLHEWTPVVWIGRLFRMDNDVGEHWFDNWDEREERETKAKALGIDDYHLMIVVPSWFADGADGPCHTEEIRKAFWTDVLKSLRLGFPLLFETARFVNADKMRHAEKSNGYYLPEELDFVPNLEERIDHLERQGMRAALEEYRPPTEEEQTERGFAEIKRRWELGFP